MRLILDGIPPARRRRGLTFTEILTVVTVLSVLIATFIPAIASANAAAKRAQCAARLRQQINGAQAFAANYSGEMLSGCRNFGGTDSYYYYVAGSQPKAYSHYFLGKLGYVNNPEKNFYCPAQTNPKFMPQAGADLINPTTTIRIGYSTFASPNAGNAQVWQSNSAYTGSEFPWNAGNFISFSGTPQRLKKLFAFDSRAVYTDGIQLYNDVDLAHQTGANVAYGDGSVKFVNRSAFEGPLSQLVHPGAAGTDNAASAALWQAFDAAH